MKKRLVRYKVYLDRSRMYLQYSNNFMLVVVFVKSWDISNKEFYFFAPAAVFLILVMALILGFYDTRLGIRSEENRNNTSHDPIHIEMMEKINEINKSLQRNK